VASYDVLRRIRPGPRVRMAARLYASGAVPTKRAACQSVGLHPAYLTVLDSHDNEVTTRIQNEVEAAIADETISLSKAIAILSRKAAQRMGELIGSQNEHVAVKASSDILDRNPETSKSFKHSVTGIVISPDDAKELAAALVAGARIREQYASVASSDFGKVEDSDNGSQKKLGKGNVEEHNGTREAPEAAGNADGAGQGEAT